MVMDQRSDIFHRQMQKPEHAQKYILYEGLRVDQKNSSK